MSKSNHTRRPRSNSYKAKQKTHYEDYDSDSDSDTSLSKFSVTAFSSGQSYRPHGSRSISKSSSSVAIASHGSRLSDKVSDEVDKTSTYSSVSDYSHNDFDVSSVLDRASRLPPSLADDVGTRLSAKVTRLVAETSRRYCTSTLGSGQTISAKTLSSLQGVRSRSSSSEPTNRINGTSHVRTARHRSFDDVVDALVRSQPGHSSRQASTRNWNSRTGHFTRPW